MNKLWTLLLGILLLGSMFVSAETIVQQTVTVEILLRGLDIHHPIDRGYYSPAPLLINFTTIDDIVINVSYSDNGGLLELLCEDCDSYSNYSNFSVGYHELEFISVFEYGEVSQTISFFIDSSIYDYEINLSKDWNLISIPLVPVNGNLNGNTIEEFFKTVKGDVDIIWAYRNKSWDFYVNETLGSLDKITPGYGYYIKMEEDVILFQSGRKMFYSNVFGTSIPPVVVINSGWNLIGQYGLKIISREEGFTSFNQNYGAMFDKQMNSKQNLEPTRGYWLFVTGQGKLNYAPSERAYDF